MNRTIFAAFLLLLAGCSPAIRVYTDYDPDYDLWKYTTFNWAYTTNIESGKNPLYYNELNDKRIKSAVQEQFANLGYILSSEKPDLVLHYHIVVDDQSVITTEPYGYYYGPYWMHTRTNVYPYREGTLILDLMDAKTNNLVWRGWAVSAINGVYSPEEIDNLIDTAVAKIFKKFPKSAKQSHPDVGIVSN